ncbi:MAG: histidine kinase [Lachnospiraceae bacterium]|nr:histidine kinase [Lachnospiraceae bacterium]
MVPMNRQYHMNLRIKVIYLSIILIFLSMFFLMNYTFRCSRNLLIEQEAGIISQYMNRSEMALEEVTDAIRKLSAASSTNKQVAAELNQSYDGKTYSSENLNRIRTVEEALTFYRNIFFDYRLHYIIMGVDGSVYSVADGIDNSNYFGQKFSENVQQQEWYQSFMESEDVSRWIGPCSYTKKGEFPAEKTWEQNGEERFLLFMRRIRDYNSLRFLGVSFVSFPTENLSQILVPYEGSSLALFNEEGQRIYQDGEEEAFPVFGSMNPEEISKEMGGKEGYFHYKKEKAEYLLNYVNIAGTRWHLVNLVPLDKTTQAIDDLYRTLSFLMFLFALGACGVCFVMYVYVNAPLNRLIRKVSQVNIGGTRISEVGESGKWGKTVFGIVEAEREIGRMVDYIEKLSAETIEQREIQQNLKYEMLRAQLNPHFLFNTLNVIKWSAMISGAANIGDMITSLGILLENSMNRKEDEVPLKEEIKVIKAWVEIKNWALKNRIQIHEEIPPELLEFKVIKFCLQPLVENSVLHGMEHVEHGEIWIRASLQENQVCIVIQDNGIGMDGERLREIMMDMDINRKQRHVTGIGLTSIHELMQVKYGPEFGLSIESEIGAGTKVYVRLPCKEESKHVKGSDCG